MSLTVEQKKIGKDNYYEAIGVTRRDFLKGAVAAGVTSGAGLGAMYFGYEPRLQDPVRVGIIGTGDEGNILIGALNPHYVDVVAICDIRPYNIHRTFHGDYYNEGTLAVRPGLMSIYGWKSEDEARQHVNVYDDYRELLKEPAIEGVIIATPLFLHHEMAIAAMQAGKHVLTEKLMGQTIAKCKEMARVASKTQRILATGHQRHYSVLYDNAQHLIRWGLLGQIHHIRAQWHRGNLPGADSWKPPLPGGEILADGKTKQDKILDDLLRMRERLSKVQDPREADLLARRIKQYEKWNEDRKVKAEDYGYEEMTLANGRFRSALEELCRWRLWDRTGGGLMAELGSHQLDAASIFISSLDKEGKKVHPLSVHAVGGRHIFPLDRDCDDHVFCLFEFPAPGYDPPQGDKEFWGYYDDVTGVPDLEKGIPGYAHPGDASGTGDPNKRIVVSYSSINGNAYGGYGETVMGTKGTLIVEREEEVLLFKDADTSSRVTVKEDRGGAAFDTSDSGAPAALAKTATDGPVSRGYREEIEHWAWCIRNPASENQPRCHPEVALGDAVIALTCNVAMKRAAEGHGGYVAFRKEWFQIDSDETPEGDTPRQV